MTAVRVCDGSVMAVVVHDVASQFRQAHKTRVWHRRTGPSGSLSRPSGLVRAVGVVCGSNTHR